MTPHKSDHVISAFIAYNGTLDDGWVGTDLGEELTLPMRGSSRRTVLPQTVLTGVISEC
jgi:hypothetical protein